MQVKQGLCIVPPPASALNPPSTRRNPPTPDGPHVRGHCRLPAARGWPPRISAFHAGPAWLARDTCSSNSLLSRAHRARFWAGSWVRSQLHSQALYTDAQTEVTSSHVPTTGFPPPPRHREAPAGTPPPPGLSPPTIRRPWGDWGLILLMCAPTPCQPCSKNQAELKTDS